MRFSLAQRPSQLAISDRTSPCTLASFGYLVRHVKEMQRLWTHETTENIVDGYKKCSIHLRPLDTAPCCLKVLEHDLRNLCWVAITLQHVFHFIDRSRCPAYRGLARTRRDEDSRGRSLPIYFNPDRASSAQHRDSCSSLQVDVDPTPHWAPSSPVPPSAQLPQHATLSSQPRETNEERSKRNVKPMHLKGCIRRLAKMAQFGPTQANVESDTLTQKMISVSAHGPKKTLWRRVRLRETRLHCKT